VKASDDIVTPAHFLRYLRTTLQLPTSEIRLPPRAFIVFGSDDFEAVRHAIRGRRTSWSEWQCLGHAGRSRAFVGRSPIGAAAAGTVMEEMAARGVRNFIGFGACGSIREDLPIGSIVLPTFAHPDDGTSRHYDAPRRPRPDARLLEALRASCRRLDLPVRAGGVWTTDAPYRESRAVARALSKEGVVAVDMEAAALYAIARFRGLRAASLMVVSDELGGEGWNPGFHHPVFLRAKRRAIRAAVDALARAGT
jgi:uridine phosphorylase